MSKVSGMYFALKRGSDVITKILQYITALLVVICFSAILLQVVYRFILVKYFTLPFSFTFTDELSRYSLVWLTYLSLGMCFKEGYMTAVDFVYNHIGSKAKKVLYYLIFVIMAVFVVITVYYGIKLINFNVIFKSPSMRLPGIYLFSAPIVGIILVAYEMFTELMGVISGELRPFSKAQIETI